MNKPIAQFRHLLIVYVFSLIITIPAFSQQPESKSGGDSWSQGADMSTGRSDFSGCSVNEKIYAFGGWSGGITISSVEEYDPMTDTWKTKASIPTPRWGLTCSVVNGKIYAIGGSLLDFTSVSTVEE